MLRLSLIVVCSIACAAAAQERGARAFELTSLDGLTLVGTRASRVDYQGWPALRLVETTPDAGERLAIVDAARFRNGVIEIDVAGQPATGAGEAARGFVGVAFRVQRDPLRYEAFYIRPTNGRADDLVRRNHSTQYASHPDFPWFVLREKHPGMYESYTDLQPGVWTPLRIVVDGVKARLFVNGAEQPALIVNDLKHGEAAGAVALWIGAGTEAYFGTLRTFDLP